MLTQDHLYSWKEALGSELQTPYMQLLQKQLDGTDFYPPKDLIFNAFRQTCVDDVRVVIVGQDPYHGEGQAHGLAFSVPQGVKIPPSLRNIFKEVGKSSCSGDLTKWARQGVLLLNTTLTVAPGAPKSHFGMGWEIFTSQVIAYLVKREDPIVFCLWGKTAGDLLGEVDRHLVLRAPHPSPLSAYTGFFGCSHFLKVNEFLKKNGKMPIDWE